MTSEQEKHLKSIKSGFDSIVDGKYRRGQAEHGGDLWDMSPMDLLNASLDEAIDQIVYLLTLKQKLLGMPLGYDSRDTRKLG
jgi:hypothetical protein